MTWYSMEEVRERAGKGRQHHTKPATAWCSEWKDGELHCGP